MTLPEGWAEATVDDLGEYLNGMAFKPTDWGVEGIGIIRIQNLTDPSKPLNRTRRAFEEAEAARARALLDRLEAALLAGAFRGELAPQDPNDEPASVLLERIRAQRASAPKPKRGHRAKETADA